MKWLTKALGWFCLVHRVGNYVSRYGVAGWWVCSTMIILLWKLLFFFQFIPLYRVVVVYVFVCVTSLFFFTFFFMFLVDVFLLFSLYLLLKHLFICLFACVEINLMVFVMRQYWLTRTSKSCSGCAVRFGCDWIGLVLRVLVNIVHRCLRPMTQRWYILSSNRAPRLNDTQNASGRMLQSPYHQPIALFQNLTMCNNFFYFNK